MRRVSLSIDGQEVAVPDGSTILEAARRAGVAIPQLCHFAGKPERGVCRLCVVEVEGNAGLVASCHTRAEPGMRVSTQGAELARHRRVLMELAMLEHGRCGRQGCEVEALASELGAALPGTEPYVEESELGSEHIEVRPTLCIHCDRCIRSCEYEVIRRMGSGFQVTMAFTGGGPLDSSPCTGCGDCIAACPAGVLVARSLSSPAE